MVSPLTTQQRNLVRRSFTQIATNHRAVARLFYDRLFEIAPDVESMFRVNMEAQREKVMQMLAALVSSIEDAPYFTRTTQDLGRRHVGYGVQDDQYRLVGDALIWAMQEACPQIMSPAVTEAWTAAYNFIAGTAIEGANGG